MASNFKQYGAGLFFFAVALILILAGQSAHGASNPCAGTGHPNDPNNPITCDGGCTNPDGSVTPCHVVRVYTSPYTYYEFCGCVASQGYACCYLAYYPPLPGQSQAWKPKGDCVSCGLTGECDMYTTEQGTYKVECK